jgi:hypothetical protein
MKKLYVILLLLAMSAVFTSCLKDSNITDDLLYGTYGVDKGPKLVEFPSAPLVNLALPALENDTSFAFTTVRVNSTNPADQDIVFTLAIDPDALQKYNDEKRAEAEENEEDYEDYLIPDPSAYTFESLTVTIPKGERSAPVNITLNPQDYLEGKWAIPLKIVSVSPAITLSANYQTLITTIGVKNKYDGVYLLSGYHNRPTLNFPYEDVEMELRTLDANTVACYFVAASSLGHPIGTGPGAISWYGAAISPAFVFDLATDKVTNVYNIPGGTLIELYTDAVAEAGQTDPAMENKYDPETKTLKVSWYYGGNPARAFFDTFVFERDR